MMTYKNDENIVEFRAESFHTLLLIAIFSLVMLSPLVMMFSGPDVFTLAEMGPIVPILVLIGTLICAYELRKHKFLRLAVWTFVVGLLLAPTAGILYSGPSLQLNMLYILPIAVAGIIIGRVEFSVAGVASLLMLGSSVAVAPRPGIYALFDGLAITWLAFLVCWLTALVTTMHTNQVFTMLQWALHSQQKDERRARLLQQEQEALARTHKELSFTHVQLKGLNEELAVARNVADEANRLKTQFLANMSHELRTPLNAIINFTRFLTKERYGSLTDRQLELQGRVLANAEHLLGLINDILDLSKIEAGRMDLFQEVIDLKPMFEGVISTAVGLTKDKGINLILDIPEPLPQVLIDKTRIRQVLLNLLSNAAKFTERGAITLQAIAVEQGMVQIAVRDTGIGIPPEHQKLIFEEFRQVQGDLTRQYEGTGLGLPISRRLVEMHGGSMGLESAPGQGSTFFFTLPIYQPVAPRQHSDDCMASVASNQPLVMVVDDDPLSQQILRHCLEPAGFAVHGVVDSRLAIDAIRCLKPQLVILDVQMPYIDGWELLSQIRSGSETAAQPVVMCSIVDEQRLGTTLGANGYLVKPVREDALVDLVKRWANQTAKVLLIDDNPDARQVIRATLEGSYQVIEASNGVCGLEAVESEQPELVILDLMMPEMDGFEVLERLRATPRHADLPVIVLTAKDLDQGERQWLLERSQSCLQKSQLSPEQFASYIHHFIGTEVHSEY